MARRCKCCAHPDRAALDAELAQRVPLRLVAARFGVSVDSAHRHLKNGHIPAAILRVWKEAAEVRGVDVEALRQRTGDGVLFALQYRKSVLEDLFKIEANAKRAFNAAALAREARSHDEALARLVGELAGPVHRHVHVLASEQWGAIRAAILRRVRARPELRGELLALLEEIEGEAPHLDGVPGGQLIEHATADGAGHGPAA